MRFKDIFQAVIIIIIFALVFCVGFVLASYKKIKNNWPEYACTPMGLAGASQFGYNTGENFTKCIGNMQSGMMDVFTTPMHFVMGTLLTSIENLIKNVADLRNLQNYMRGTLGSFTGDIFGIIQNVLIQFQKMIMAIRDIMSKLLGVVATMFYMITGTMLLGASILNGPIMLVLNIVSFGAACFRADTPIKLNNGKITAIKDLHLGDVLVNGSTVIGTLQLRGDQIILTIRYTVRNYKTTSMSLETIRYSILHKIAL